MIDREEPLMSSRRELLERLNRKEEALREAERTSAAEEEERRKLVEREVEIGRSRRHPGL
jgi:hypothetical protein